MEHLIVQLFKPILAYSSQEDLVAYLFKHPVLMSPYYTELLEGWAATLSGPQQSIALRCIALKKEAWDKVTSKTMKGPEISNPVLDLAESVIEGRITEQYACQAGARPEFFVELMFPMIEGACDLAEDLVKNSWRPAVTIMRIMLAALDGRRSQIPENQQAMDLSAVETWVGNVTRAIVDVPDGRLYHDAVRRGDAFADIISPDRNPPGQILHRLGVLHLDPYVGGRTTSQWEQQLRAWQTRLEEEYGQTLAGVPAEELHVPRIEAALPKAVEYFRRAAAVRNGEDRGRTLKATAQALFWQNVIKLPVDPAEIVAAAQESLSLLPRERFPSEFAEMSAIVKRFANVSTTSSGSSRSTPTTKSKGEKLQSGDSSQLANARDVLATPVDEWVKRLGRIQAEELFQQSAMAVRGLEPMLAQKLWMEIAGLMREEPEPRRRSYFRAGVDFASSAFAPGSPSADGSPVATLFESLLRAAEREKWNWQKLGYALLSLALSTTMTDQEEDGLDLLETSARVNDGRDSWLAILILWARAEMTLNSGVNAYNRNDFTSAARFYSAALGYQLDVQQPLGALDMLRRLRDLAKSDRPELDQISKYVLASLAKNALALEIAAGDAATYEIQSTCRQLLALLYGTGNIKLTVALILLDVAKGRRFGTALAKNAAIPWLKTPRTIELEAELAQLRAQAEHDAPVNPSAIDEEMLLAGYVSPSQMRGGATATERLRNLQIQFDTVLDRQLSSAEEANTWIPTTEIVQELLDDKTVLMIQYIGIAPTGETALTTLLISKQESVLGMGLRAGMPFASVVLSSGEETVTSDFLSFPVSELRRVLRSPPGPRVADSRAVETLERDLGFYLGGDLRSRLAAFRKAGKDHLCICAHGALHYYPLHLLGPEDQPLAAEWRVTYLPALRLLSRVKQAGTSTEGGKAELAAIGVNFMSDNPHRLPPLDEPEPEALAIAMAYNTTAIIGSAATESAVKYALTHSRRVHISTHGRHNVSAPAFQCLYVQPDDQDDGVIHAYELLQLDLHELDLVTLSACETALGRFDTADNLRGIPAALLIAGVRTIVGTLWPVEANTATRFFEGFYAELKDTGNKLEAFYRAQKQTRKEFPKYRDWGAFQMIGAWD